MKMDAVVTEKLPNCGVKILLKGDGVCTGNCGTCGMCSAQSVWNAVGGEDAEIGDEVIVKPLAGFNMAMIIFGYFLPVAMTFFLYYIGYGFSEYAAIPAALAGVIAGFFLSAYVKCTAKKFSAAFKVVKVKHKCRFL